MSEPSRASLTKGITFHNAGAFWVGTAAVTAGVVMHIPDFAAASGMGYHMAGMAMSRVMEAGMLLIVFGLAAAAYGLIPFSWRESSGLERGVEGVHIHAMDGARLTSAHWGLLFVLGVALIVDVMKPATLGFVVPGMKDEYGLTTGQVALLPIFALTGTTLGSFVWGLLADRVGRRAAILLASIMFIGTSICGFMPSFRWNLFMCFVMGISAGGMLPIVYALMAESIPARKRGWLVVLHGGMGTVGGYLVAAGLAALLEPTFSWRILWFMGLPTGLLVLLLNRWIPESPRFLLERGRVDEAESVMARYGVVIERAPGAPEVALGLPAGLETFAAGAGAASEVGVGAPHGGGPTPPGPRHPGGGGAAGPGLAGLFRPPLLPQTLTIGAYGLGWGLVNWGFLTFVPTILRDRGLDAGSASRLLFLSALIAVPGTVLVAYLYGLWSSKKSMILFAGVTAAALIGFAAVDPGSTGAPSPLLTPMMVLLLVGSGGVISMLSPYTAEVYPTALRGTGSGFAAGSSKVGGIFGPPVVALILGLSPGFTALGVTVAIPVAFSALLLAVTGIETRDRGLEELTARIAPDG